jgi:hypothetical protein
VAGDLGWLATLAGRPVQHVMRGQTGFRERDLICSKTLMDPLGFALGDAAARANARQTSSSPANVCAARGVTWITVARQSVRCALRVTRQSASSASTSPVTVLDVTLSTRPRTLVTVPGWLAGAR